MTKDAKLLSLCMTVMLSAPFSGMAQPKGYRQDAPFPPVSHIVQVRQTPPVKKDGMTKGNQSTVVRPAWTAQLNDENVFHLFTVIDNNKDDATWIFFKDGYGSGNTCYKYNAQEAADDWLISPYIELKAGTNYNIRFHARANSSYYKETLKVCVGTEPTVAGMAAGQVILPSTEIGGDTVSFSKTFTPVTDGNYCIGFHAGTEADHNRLYLYDLTVEEGAVNAAPDAPTALPPMPGRTKARKPRQRSSSAWTLHRCRRLLSSKTTRPPSERHGAKSRKVPTTEESIRKGLCTRCSPSTNRTGRPSP